LGEGEEPLVAHGRNEFCVLLGRLKDFALALEGKVSKLDGAAGKPSGLELHGWERAVKPI
jgi:hypothetical protein